MIDRPSSSCDNGRAHVVLLLNLPAKVCAFLSKKQLPSSTRQPAKNAARLPQAYQFKFTRSQSL